MNETDHSGLDSYFRVQVKELTDGGYMGSWYCKLCRVNGPSNHIARDREWEHDMMITSGRAHVWKEHPEVRRNP
jgi:hypothetical protein